MVNRTLKCHVIKRVLVESESGCDANCFADDDCMSINLGPKTEDKRHICEISNSDHDIHPNDMWNMTGFIYKPVWVNTDCRSRAVKSYCSVSKSKSTRSLDMKHNMAHHVNSVNF